MKKMLATYKTTFICIFTLVKIMWCKVADITPKFALTYCKTSTPLWDGGNIFIVKSEEKNKLTKQRKETFVVCCLLNFSSHDMEVHF
jgi:hypothetical protein